MCWELNESVNNERQEPTCFTGKRDAFVAMCNRVAELTGFSSEDIIFECDSDIIWTADIGSVWAVVGKSFGWIKGSDNYGWDIREVE